jgi:hypothetical protein
MDISGISFVIQNYKMLSGWRSLRPSGLTSTGMEWSGYADYVWFAESGILLQGWHIGCGVIFFIVE